MPIIPEGTRFVLPPEWEWREALKQRLQTLFSAWGYSAVQTPALEFADPHHPQDARAFKLVDRDGSVLALRSEYTTAVGQLVRSDLATAPYPLRLYYAGQLWLRSQTSELGRMREFTQVGVELVGVSSARSDAELLALARESLEVLGVRFQLEIGHPGFVRAVLESSGLPESELAALHDAVDRKAQPELDALLGALDVQGAARVAISALPDLYGGLEVLPAARRIAPSEQAAAALDRLEEAVALSGSEDYILDLGMSRRYSYYTGLTFRAYTPDFGQPLLGGGRYDTGIPGAGFAIGLERAMRALGGPPPAKPVDVLALDLASARMARAAGYRTELALDPGSARQHALERGIRYLALEGRLEEVRA
ncbi:ATP phosphoribosyltransferase regulatory subunit [Deinobacterium chartae]|uniref:ATP phosphoribosyltransferase regulatory subunit n=1 Tax=Deinobacterium chartae TaxID=521158 RepID=A0A841I0E6_9DEIO|nr:ATP phosphoribosyltransferase regulatory subunit [Deinobacterium chartae]MBB6097455.1 ATP phosphoribosyltransferase regulatory subunit [Deinobacterium chartae]